MVVVVVGGPRRKIWSGLYAMLDIFSRKAMRWEMHATENAALAAEFIQNAIAANQGTAPRYIHADRGRRRSTDGTHPDMQISSGPVLR